MTNYRNASCKYVSGCVAYLSFAKDQGKSKNIWREHLKNTHSFLKIGTTMFATMLSVFYYQVCLGGGQERVLRTSISETSP